MIIKISDDFKNTTAIIFKLLEKNKDCIYDFTLTNFLDPILNCIVLSKKLETYAPYMLENIIENLQIIYYTLKSQGIFPEIDMALFDSCISHLHTIELLQPCNQQTLYFLKKIHNRKYISSKLCFD